MTRIEELKEKMDAAQAECQRHQQALPVNDPTQSLKWISESRELERAALRAKASYVRELIQQGYQIK